MLNGTRVFWDNKPLDNPTLGAGLATYAAVKESLERLQSAGIHMVYTHNYDCKPGTHLTCGVLCPGGPEPSFCGGLFDQS